MNVAPPAADGGESERVLQPASRNRASRPTSAIRPMAGDGRRLMEICSMSNSGESGNLPFSLSQIEALYKKLGSPR
jgi:hypothetical protein